MFADFCRVVIRTSLVEDGSSSSYATTFNNYWQCGLGRARLLRK